MAVDVAPPEAQVAPEREAIRNRDRELLVDAQSRGFFPTLGAFVRLSGPGWLQSAITLGGGSLASAMYLGVLTGLTMLWVQPFAMILGVVMLSAIAYVTTTTGKRPFGLVNRRVNPVLGWSWALASLAASMVWSMPQYALSTDVLEKNLLPSETLAQVNSFWAGVLPESFPLAAGTGGGMTTAMLCAIIFVASLTVAWLYESGGWGIKVYETILKIMVLSVVVCFVGVVIALRNEIDWSAVATGFLPDPMQMLRPSPAFDELLGAIGSQAGEANATYWRNFIVDKQRGVLISAAATAVGINMTFFFPYSMLAKRWTKEFRGLAIFDLATGMVIPFTIAISCVVIAASAQFHPKPGVIELQEGEVVDFNLEKPYRVDLLAQRDPAAADAFAKLSAADQEARQSELPPLSSAERKLALHLKDRNAFELSASLKPFVGEDVANYAFGLGVLGMTLSTIVMLMLISGFVVCEMLGIPPKGWPNRLGCLVAVTGVLGPFLWKNAGFYVAIPTSVFAMILLPIAYISFMALMNQKTVLGDDMPRGGRRIVWNLLMFISTAVALSASLWSLWNQSFNGVKLGWLSVPIVGGFLLLVLIVQVVRKKPPEPQAEAL
ncbi:MAG TPA: divalent metal cation transporter [Pirellulaceae bacterium]|jgi:Mn2+/Fe2+ NRAMP family transporter|nr:divalent metal cation transporter [Pirellulaceae bacterium]